MQNYKGYVNSLETFDSDKEENNYMKDSENVLLNNKNNINNDNEQNFSEEENNEILSDYGDNIELLENNEFDLDCESHSDIINSGEDEIKSYLDKNNLKLEKLKSRKNNNGTKLFINEKTIR